MRFFDRRWSIFRRIFTITELLQIRQASRACDSRIFDIRIRIFSVVERENFGDERRRVFRRIPALGTSMMAVVGLGGGA